MVVEVGAVPAGLHPGGGGEGQLRTVTVGHPGGRVGRVGRVGPAVGAGVLVEQEGGAGRGQHGGVAVANDGGGGG